MIDTRHRLRWARRAAALPLAFALVLGGCDSLLEVSQPGAVLEEDLNNPGLARMLVVGALGKFECGVTSYGMGTGILADEFWTAANFRGLNAWAQRVDIRVEVEVGSGGCGSSTASFFALQQARSQGEDAYERISGFPAAQVPERERFLAMTAAYVGYAYNLLGEGFCRMTLDGGPPMPPQDVLQIAEQRLTTALDHAVQAGDDDIRYMALAGRARVRLNLGKGAEAVQDAEQIPEGWVRYAEHSDVVGARNNRVWVTNNLARSFTVSPPYRGLEVDGVPDPRVPVEFTGGLGQDGVTPAWVQLKYPTRTSPTRIASWVEAQLIIAEVVGGQRAVGIINDLRNRHGLPSFASNDEQEIFQQVIEERRREFFAEGHRINDMLRHNIPFPTGTDHQGNTYGPMTCMFLPRVEVNSNPHL